MDIDIDIDDEPLPAKPKFALRGRQSEWLAKILEDLKIYSRLLVVAPGGVGKTTLFAALAANLAERGIKTLVLANRDRLTRQTADRITKETGLTVEIEMGSEHASPFAQVVVASVQTLSRVNRLTGFADSHFGLIVPDEAHFSVSDGFQRVIKFFHYGSQSLQEDWQVPADGTYEPKAAVVGFTATPDIGTRRNLGEIYQHKSVSYSYLEAVKEGWLVGPIQKSIPVKIDIRKSKVGGTQNGNDFLSSDLSVALIPVIEELAEQIAVLARDRKTIAFLPSVECARMMTEALIRKGVNAIMVSGACEDGDEKTDAFMRAGKGSVLCNAQIYNFGVDFPDVDCVAWFRATLSRAFYEQGIYRGTRILPGVIDSRMTTEERLLAIARSAKPNLLILDPLFVSDRIDLLDSYDLFTDKPEVKKRMKEEGELSAEAAEKAERDFIKALEKEAKKHAAKKARTVNPLALAVSLGDAALATWQPETTADMRPPSEKQLDLLRRFGIDPAAVKYAGLASKLIGRVLTRSSMKLATPKQLSFLTQLGYSEEAASTLTQEEATAAIEAAKEEKRNSRLTGE